MKRRKHGAGPIRRKARPLLVAAAGATLLALPGISGCGDDVGVDMARTMPDLSVRGPDGNLPAPNFDLSVPYDLADRRPDGNLLIPDLAATPDLSNRLPDGNLPSITPDLLNRDQ